MPAKPCDQHSIFRGTHFRAGVSLLAAIMLAVALAACDGGGAPSGSEHEPAGIATEVAVIPTPTPTAPATSTAGPTATASAQQRQATPEKAASTTIAAVPPTPTPGLLLAQTSPETDRRMLIAFYNATGGSQWTNSDNWLSDEPLENWRGVRTDTEGRVTSVSLTRNDLVGSLPAELWNLVQLEYLNLSDNPELTGGLPAGIGRLVNLERLDLSATGLSGELPAVLGDLKMATMPPMGTQGGGASLIIVDTALCLTPELEEAFVSRVGYVDNGIGASLCEERARLEAVYQALDGDNWPAQAKENWLSNEPLHRWRGVDTENGRVVTLSLAGNNLRGTLPGVLWELTGLEVLSLSDNPKLTGGLPAGIGRLVNLERLDLSETGLSGELPAVLGDLKLATMSTGPYGRDASLGIYDTALCLTPELEEAFVSRVGIVIDGDLAGWLCEERSRLEAIYEALDGDNWHAHAKENWLSNKPLHGWRGVTTENGRVVVLSLDGSNLMGPLPEALWELAGLEVLSLSDNPELTGELPAGIGRLVNLERLHLG